jgi:sec-independent protein translocase protein TatB
MFDIGFSEIALIAVVALLVLGPERLPKVARTAGALLRRARSSWQNVRSEIERELAAEDLKKTMREAGQDADVRADIKAAGADIERAARNASTSPASKPTADHERS